MHFCSATGVSPAPEDVDGYSLAEFLAHLAHTAPLQSSTIATYRSAVSSWAHRGTLSDESSAGSSAPVSLVMQGIINSKRPAENARKQARREEEPALTPEMLAAILEVVPGACPRNAMLMAAAHVGVYGLLRPIEMLGARGSREEEALRLSQVTFYHDKAEAVVAAHHKNYATAVSVPLPHHFVIRLGATKADREGANKPKVVASEPAVAALWFWLHLRRDLRPPAGNEFIFLNPHTWSFLNIVELMKQLTVWGKEANVTSFDFVGRSMRRGGAEALVGGGASIPDVQAAGRWRSVAMPALYAGAAGGRQRQLLISKAMAPSPASLGDRV